MKTNYLTVVGLNFSNVAIVEYTLLLFSIVHRETSIKVRKFGVFCMCCNRRMNKVNPGGKKIVFGLPQVFDSWSSLEISFALTFTFTLSLSMNSFLLATAVTMHHTQSHRRYNGYDEWHKKEIDDH